MSSVSGLRKAGELVRSVTAQKVAPVTPSRPPKSVVAFTRYSAGSASSRVRIHQFVESIQEDGWILEVHDFVTDDFTNSRYRGKTHFLRIPGMFFRRAYALHNSRQADLVWVQREAMPWMPFWVERIFLPNKPTIYDFDDAIHIQYQSHRSRLVRFLLGNKIAQIARSANCIIAGNLELKRYMEKMGAQDVVVIPSVIHSIPGNRPKSQGKTRPFIICYTGNLYEEFQDPEPLVQALYALKEAGDLPKDAIVVKFYGTRLSRAKELALDERYSEFIRIEGHVSREDALLAQREADVLLLLEDANEESRGILTGKLFEYLTSGTPVLCIGSLPDFEIGKILSATGVGAVVPPEDFRSLPALLSATLRREGLFDKYHPNFEEIMRYSRKAQAVHLFDTIVERLQQSTKLSQPPSQ